MIGLSPAIWLLLGGGVVLWLFMAWESHRIAHGDEPLVNPAILKNLTLRGGLTSFFFQYLLQGGLFFAVPLFLSVALGLSAIATGVRLLPLSITLLLAAAGIPKVFPNASPRRVVQLGFLSLFAGLVVMIAALDAGAGPEIVTWPMLLAGLGVGALASQLGSVTVSSVPDEQSGEVGGLQNTAHEPRRVDRHRAGRRRAHLRPHRILHDRHPEQPGGASPGQINGQDSAGRRGPVRLRRRSENRTSEGRTCHTKTVERDRQGKLHRPPRRPTLITVRTCRHRPGRLPFSRRIPTLQPASTPVA